MVVEMACCGAESLLGIAICVEACFAKTLVGVLVVRSEIQVVLDQQRASKCVIADAVTANPRIDKGQRNKEEQKKNARRKIAKGGKLGSWDIQTFHSRSTPPKGYLQESVPAVDPESPAWLYIV